MIMLSHNHQNNKQWPNGTICSLHARSAPPHWPASLDGATLPKPNASSPTCRYVLDFFLFISFEYIWKYRYKGNLISEMLNYCNYVTIFGFVWNVNVNVNLKFEFIDVKCGNYWIFETCFNSIIWIVNVNPIGL